MSTPARLGDVIADFLRDAAEGRVRTADDRPYTPGDVRDLRAALGHVDAELGRERICALRVADIEALVEGLRAAGLSERRLAAMLEALRALDAYTAARRLDPIPVPRGSRPAPAPEPVGAPAAPTAAPLPAPTQVVLALGARAGAWTVRAIVAAFLLLAIMLVAGFD